MECSPPPSTCFFRVRSDSSARGAGSCTLTLCGLPEHGLRYIQYIHSSYYSVSQHPTLHHHSHSQPTIELPTPITQIILTTRFPARSGTLQLIRLLDLPAYHPAQLAARLLPYHKHIPVICTVQCTSPPSRHAILSYTGSRFPSRPLSRSPS